jgi:hypothetical protein
MLPDMSEYPCQVDSINVDGVRLLSDQAVEQGIPVIAYLEEIGRIDGILQEAFEGGFYVAFNLSGPRRERMQRRLELLQSPDADQRRHERFLPNQSESQLTLADGRQYECEVIDISVSGAAIKTEVLPAIGTYVTLGKMRGRVVRFTDNGLAIEFLRTLDTNKLKQQILS